jgi:hypothetical protein
MHRVFGNEGGFGDRELRIIRSGVKRRTQREPFLSERNTKSTPGSPSPRPQRDKAA